MYERPFTSASLAFAPEESHSHGVAGSNVATWSVCLRRLFLPKSDLDYFALFFRGFAGFTPSTAFTAFAAFAERSSIFFSPR